MVFMTTSHARDTFHTFHARDAAEWRAWLERNGSTEREVWLVIHNKDSGTPSVRYNEAIEQALCFGWIDSHTRKTDPDSTLQRFSPRRPASSWSALNRERAARMITAGLMTPAGQAMIDLAKSTGRWSVDASMPAELQSLLDADPVAASNFVHFPPSSKRLILEWIANAKKPETRHRRITQTVALAAQNLRANHPTSPR